MSGGLLALRHSPLDASTFYVVFQGAEPDRRKWRNRPRRFYVNFYWRYTSRRLMNSSVFARSTLLMNFSASCLSRTTLATVRQEVMVKK